MNTDTQREIESLSLDILTLSRNQLLIRLRFLEPALLMLTLCPDAELSFATDGIFLYYGPTHVLRTYQMGQEHVTASYLHMVLHCLFHHPFVGPAIDKVCWDTAADIAVTAVLLELALPYIHTGKEERQKEIIKALREEVPLLSAEKLYHFFHEQGLETEQLLTLRDLFLLDEHESWYTHTKTSSEEEKQEESQEEKEGKKEENAKGKETNQEEEGEEVKTPGEEALAPAGKEGPQESNSLYPAEEDPSGSWKDITSQVQTDLTTLSLEYGEKSGTLLRTLQVLTREKKDYGEFLRAFTVPTEVIRSSQEEFDYISYTYGLSLYGNVPLVEPLEYSDRQRIRDLALVIDTSASVAGDLLKAFLQKTLEILKSQDTFLEVFRLHLIQCDAAVQEDEVITSTKELDAYLADMSVKGFGGTDYRPAFTYVEELLEKGDLGVDASLLYLTDGEGIYPKEAPPFKSAFVFLTDSYEDRDVPPWAAKLVLEKEEDL